MIGIYKIENIQNHKCYIGQSVHIERRWQEHCRPSCNSVIGKALKKEGKQNFSFQVLEECSIVDLDKKEQEYIEKYNSIVPNGYNVTDYIQGQSTVFNVYDKEILLKIVEDLKSTQMTIIQLSEKYDLNKSTIYRINQGIIHHLENETYPLRPSLKGTNQQGKPKSSGKKLCPQCGTEICSHATLCTKCAALASRKVDRPTREELKNLIKSYPFTQIGKMYNLSDNAIRKWCKGYDLPHKASEIKRLTDEEWEQI